MRLICNQQEEFSDTTCMDAGAVAEASLDSLLKDS